MRLPLLLILALASPAAAGAQSDLLARPGGLETAGFEDYREPAGRLDGGVLRIVLEAQPVAWRPWGPDGPAILAHTFAADGAAPRTPAPLIRATVGTPVHVTLRNRFEHPLVVRGFRSRTPLPEGVAPGPGAIDSVTVPPGATVEIRFTPLVPGTFTYGGNVRAPEPVARTVPGAGEGDRSFVGVMIIDPEGGPREEERFLLITHWGDRDLPGSWLPATRFFVNGRSWPHTERLDYAQGDTVRWRVINFSGRVHPMHLHGFYFRVDARGDLFGERVYAPEERRLAVTEALAPGETMRLTWVPEEPGNWIFHCHFMRHMSHLQLAPLQGPAASHRHATGEGEDLMGGLVLGITVRPGPGYEPSPEVPRRRLTLSIGRRPGVFGEEPGYGFVLQEGPEPPAPDSVRFPGSPLVLSRGEPTEIVVHNRADVPLGVHWHGLELESWADGVPGWSGMPGRAVPAIAPGDSLAVRMTPPRAGTFMYHVHSEPGHQLAQGLYGAFLVLRPGEDWDRDTDRVFLLGSLGVGEDPPAAVNGRLEPEPVELRLGTTYRLRFMHISPDDEKRVQLLEGDAPLAWRVVAKDGADLPASQARTAPADLRIHVGETYDFLWAPERAGEFSLRVTTTFDRGAPLFPRPAPPPSTMEIPVRVW
jgi:manganese oxidase